MITGLFGGATVWGVSGPTFLGWYLAVAVGTVIVVALVWYRSLCRPVGRGGVLTLNDQTDPYLAAYLNGGADLALLSAVAALHSAHRLGAGEVGVPSPEPGSALEQAVLAETAEPCPFGRLAMAGRVREALDQLRDELLRDGMLLTDARRARIRSCRHAVTALLVVGMARLAADMAEDNPVGGLLPCVLTLGVLAVVLGVSAPVRTVRGRRAVSMLRTKYGYLHPSMQPHWAAQGARGAALGVAVFGTAALEAAAPEVAVGIAGTAPWTVGGGKAGAR